MSVQVISVRMSVQVCRMRTLRSLQSFIQTLAVQSQGGGKSRQISIHTLAVHMAVGKSTVFIHTLAELVFHDELFVVCTSIGRIVFSFKHVCGSEVWQN